MVTSPIQKLTNPKANISTIETQIAAKVTSGGSNASGMLLGRKEWRRKLLKKPGKGLKTL